MHTRSDQDYGPESDPPAPTTFAPPLPRPTPIYTPTDEERELAVGWHGGQGSMLYAVASHGHLARGSVMPYHVDTDDEWNADLLDRLARELVECDMTGHDDDGIVRDGWVETLYAMLDDCDIVGHEWGLPTRSRLSGTVHLPCTRVGCRAISLDLDA